MRRLGGRGRGMLARRPVRCWAGCLTAVAAVCLSPAAGLALGSGGAAGNATGGGGSGASSSGSGASSGSALGSLVVPGVQSLDGAQQAQAAEQARLANPAAVAARAASRTEYEGLGAAQAKLLASAAFPEVVDRPAGTLRSLFSGQRIVSYPSDNSARVDLSGGRHGVIESTEPIALETSPGHREPLDLSLEETAGAFTPARAAVAVHIPKQLAGGVRLASTGVSLTPVAADGSALSGSEGTIDGATVLYANTQTDADTVVKPLASGFQADTVLRSIDSPEQLSYRLGLPRGASIARNLSASGAVQILENGHLVGVVLPPVARDAAGTTVPVSMRVAGDTLKFTVDDRSGSYEYPIDVDPTIVDSNPELYPLRGNGNWKVATNGKITSEGESYQEPGHVFVDTGIAGSLIRGEVADLNYTTEGESKIKALRVRASIGGTGIKSALAIIGSTGNLEIEKESPGPELEEISTAGSNGNSAALEAIGTALETTFETKVYASEVTIEQTAEPHVSMDTTEEVVNGEENALYGSRWASATSGKWGLKAIATDAGLGISKETWTSPNAPKWRGKFSPGSPDQVPANGCHGPVQCAESWLPSTLLAGESGTGYEVLPEGEDTVELKVKDPAGLEASATAKVKVDNTPPHSVLSGLPSSHEINDGQHLTLTASSTDTLSGVASIVLTMDGAPVGSPASGCTGSCTAKGEWPLSGASYAAGPHTLAVVATDNAGNVSREEYPLTIHHAGPLAVGPGGVNPVTGELSLKATDVSVSASGGGLTVTRSYGSRHSTAGAEGPLGPQWSIATGAQESLSRGAKESMILTSTGGQQSVFASNGKGGYTSPTGDAGLVLSEKIVGSATDFVLSDNGTATTFAVPSGGSGGLWEPAISEGAGATNAITYAYKTEGGVTEPTEELAPVPAGVSCSPTLNNGCRALAFGYAKETTAKGEGPSEWGEYKGRLKEVTFTAYEPASKAMKTKTLAVYVYDKQGRLRAEWNPEVTPAPLKTVYGYDSEGHVTSLAPAGQQPWLIEQGTAAGDVAPGRVLAIARPAASTAAELKAEMEASAPVNTVVPTLSSTTPTVGVKILVSTNGTWSNSPLAYSYQWEDCNSTGKECTPIPGAVNKGYYPVASDEGHALVAEVVALNANGSAVASSAATAVVAKGTPSNTLPEPPSVGSLSVWTIDYQVPLSGAGAPQQMGSAEVAKWGQSDDPAEAAAVFPPDQPMGWPAREYERASIYYLDARDRQVNVAGPTGGISTSEYNTSNDVIRTLSPDDRATALSAGEKSAEVSKELDDESTYKESGSEPGTELLSTLGPKHAIGLTNGTKTEGREHTVYSYNEGAPKEGGPYHLVTKTTEGAQVAGKEEAASVRTTKTSYSGQHNLGWTLRKPTSVTVEPSGLNLTHSIFYESKTGAVTETRMPAAGTSEEESGGALQAQFGKLGSESEQFKEPQSIVVNAEGDEFVLDTGNNRIEEYSKIGKLVTTIGSGQLKEPRGITLDKEGNLWVANTGASDILEFTASSSYKTAKNWFSAGKPEGIVITGNANVWVVETGQDFVSKYQLFEGQYIKEGGFGKKGSEPTGMLEPEGIAIGEKGYFYIADTGNNRIDEYTEAGEHVESFGTEGTATGQFKAPSGVGTDSAGDVWVADTGNNRIQEFSPKGVFTKTFGKEGTSEGKMKAPRGVAVDSEGEIWVADTGDSNVQGWTANGSGYGPGTSHDTQTIYYTSAGNSQIAACGEHPEWANLPCQVQPAGQPEGSLPKLEVTTYTYNMFDEPLTTVNTSGSNTRTTTDTYDSAGRMTSTHTTTTAQKALNTVTDKYSETLGVLEEQSVSVEGKARPTVSHYNTLGQLASYTDASESTTTYEYDVDGRISKVNDGKGVETYTYNKTTGLPTELLNEYGTTKLPFTATYDTEGNMLTEGYPNGMSATYTYNAAGTPTNLQYKKTTHCTEEKEQCIWFKDAAMPSIHGQWLTQESTLSKQSYTYDGIGRLTQVQNTPVGKGCTTRVYAYDEDGNRTSLKTYEPNAKNECATEHDTEEKHTYDSADRLTDTGISYTAFGDVGHLPAADAGGEILYSEYYVDNQLAVQRQGSGSEEQALGYNLDPGGRTLETIATGKRSETVTNHYAGPGATPAWTSSTSGETTREIPGINGQLAATQNSLSEPVLQLTNLHGDIIATAYLSETATALASKADTSEYGVPTTSLPPKYSWLGALDIPTELPSGAMNMGARSYVPQLGRFLQPDPIPGGSANAYSYTFDDPVNTSDPSGESSLIEYEFGHGAQVGREALEAEEAARRAAEEAAARAAAERAAQEAAEYAAWSGGAQYMGEGEEWYEEEYEEGGYEYASYHHGGAPEGQTQGESLEAHSESAVLYQPLGGGESDGSEARSSNGDDSSVFYVHPYQQIPGRIGYHPRSQCTRSGDYNSNGELSRNHNAYNPEAHPNYRYSESASDHAAGGYLEYGGQGGEDVFPEMPENPNP